MASSPLLREKWVCDLSYSWKHFCESIPMRSGIEMASSPPSVLWNTQRVVWEDNDPVIGSASLSLYFRGHVMVRLDYNTIRRYTLQSKTIQRRQGISHMWIYRMLTVKTLLTHRGQYWHGPYRVINLRHYLVEVYYSIPCLSLYSFFGGVNTSFVCFRLLRCCRPTIL